MIAEGLGYSLQQEGYEVWMAFTMAESFAVLRQKGYPDICLLDVRLPDGDGLTICREIRKESRIPVLFLTACDDEVHTVMALEQGADDYITKPFRIRELMARIKAILRRAGLADAGGSVQQEMRIGDTRVNVSTGKVYRGSEEIVLTAMEYRLLLIFLNNRGQILTRQQILNNIWDDVGDYVNDNTLSVYVKRLRAKLKDDPEHPMLTTVRGIGYRLEKQGGQ